MERSNKLKSKIIEKGFSIISCAMAAGIDKSKFYRKIKAPETFSIEEAERIMKVLDLTVEEFMFIFFTRSVA